MCVLTRRVGLEGRGSGQVTVALQKTKEVAVSDSFSCDRGRQQHTSAEANAAGIAAGWRVKVGLGGAERGGLRGKARRGVQ